MKAQYKLEDGHFLVDSKLGDYELICRQYGHMGFITYLFAYTEHNVWCPGCKKELRCIEVVPEENAEEEKSA